MVQPWLRVPLQELWNGPQRSNHSSKGGVRIQSWWHCPTYGCELGNLTKSGFNHDGITPHCPSWHFQDLHKAMKMLGLNPTEQEVCKIFSERNWIFEFLHRWLIFPMRLQRVGISIFLNSANSSWTALGKSVTSLHCYWFWLVSRKGGTEDDLFRQNMFKVLIFLGFAWKIFPFRWCAAQTPSQRISKPKNTGNLNQWRSLLTIQRNKHRCDSNEIDLWWYFFQAGEARVEQGGLCVHHEELAGACGRVRDRRDVRVRW